jgi:hypothetical protein
MGTDTTIKSGSVYRGERAIAQTAIIVVSVAAHFLWQYAANEGKVDADTQALFANAGSSLSVLIAFFLGVQFGQDSTKRTSAMGIVVQLDGAKYFLQKRGIWITRSAGYHPLYFLDSAFASDSKTLETQLAVARKGGNRNQVEMLKNEVEIKKKLAGLSAEFPNFDAFSYFDGLAGLLGQLHALAHVHSESNTFTRLFRVIVLIAYGVAIPLGSTILPSVGETVNGFTKWQFYVTVLVNILILIVYFSIDYSQTHSVKRLADLDRVTDYWRLKDSDWLPRTDETGDIFFLDTTTTSEGEIERLGREEEQQKAQTRVRMRYFSQGERLKSH